MDSATLGGVDSHQKQWLIVNLDHTRGLVLLRNAGHPHESVAEGIQELLQIIETMGEALQSEWDKR